MGKQGFVTEFNLIDKTAVNRNICNLNARSTFELVENDNSKYFLSSNGNCRINTQENNMKNIFKISLDKRYTSNLK